MEHIVQATILGFSLSKFKYKLFKIMECFLSISSIDI